MSWISRSERIKTAKNTKGDKGEVISAAEKKEIYEALHELEDKIIKVKTSVEKS